MADAPKAYAIDAAEGVSVHLDDSSEDEKFNISVHKDGAEVETHEGVTADSVTDLGSEHFTASYIDPPVPEKGDDE